MLLFTKGMGEMFTFKQRGVCLFVIYFTSITLARKIAYINALNIFSQSCQIESVIIEYYPFIHRAFLYMRTNLICG